ncbi:hypothetical protein RFI_26640 [Reticulomyxa filosa]|uniref:Uncharacterized protein n=1 Tax=Reticulomyxa filosa TaxID=46433 RepID=X6MAQ0_RETFI|nr:hypothetical protein RFI_26640 [Reticulomyxa filosa]|eukprot:ETO10736.1 hypothetical protein RFI_26640 [Reticulomyxa filosa]
MVELEKESQPNDKAMEIIKEVGLYLKQHQEHDIVLAIFYGFGCYDKPTDPYFDRHCVYSLPWCVVVQFAKRPDFVPLLHIHDPSQILPSSLIPELEPDVTMREELREPTTEGNENTQSAIAEIVAGVNGLNTEPREQVLDKQDSHSRECIPNEETTQTDSKHEFQSKKENIYACQKKKKSRQKKSEPSEHRHQETTESDAETVTDSDMDHPCILDHKDNDNATVSKPSQDPTDLSHNNFEKDESKVIDSNVSNTNEGKHSQQMDNTNDISHDKSNSSKKKQSRLNQPIVINSDDDDLMAPTNDYAVDSSEKILRRSKRKKKRPNSIDENDTQENSSTNHFQPKKQPQYFVKIKFGLSILMSQIRLLKKK